MGSDIFNGNNFSFAPSEIQAYNLSHDQKAL